MTWTVSSSVSCNLLPLKLVTTHACDGAMKSVKSSLTAPEKDIGVLITAV